MINEVIQAISHDFEENLRIALKPYGITAENIEENKLRITFEFIQPDTKPNEKIDFFELKRVYVDGVYAFTIETKINHYIGTHDIVYESEIWREIRSHDDKARSDP